MKRFLLIISIACCSAMSYGETVNMATEVFVTNYVHKTVTNYVYVAVTNMTNYVHNTVTNYVEKAAPNKTIAMFIIPLNNPMWQDSMFEARFCSFCLKASTNNFNNGPSQTVFSSDSDYANTPNGFLYPDRMKLFICRPSDEGYMSYTYVTNTFDSIFDRSFESVIAVVDLSCLLLSQSGSWLQESNNDLSWCFTRKYSQYENYFREQELHNEFFYWHPIMPVKWFSKLPVWAVTP